MKKLYKRTLRTVKTLEIGDLLVSRLRIPSVKILTTLCHELPCKTDAKSFIHLNSSSPVLS